MPLQGSFNSCNSEVSIILKSETKVASFSTSVEWTNSDAPLPGLSFTGAAPVNVPPSSPDHELKGVETLKTHQNLATHFCLFPCRYRIVSGVNIGLGLTLLLTIIHGVLREAKSGVRELQVSFRPFK